MADYGRLISQFVILLSNIIGKFDYDRGSIYIYNVHFDLPLYSFDHTCGYRIQLSEKWGRFSIPFQ
jgi:hypothetical protein